VFCVFWGFLPIIHGMVQTPSLSKLNGDNHTTRSPYIYGVTAFSAGIDMIYEVTVFSSMEY
jgi:hypothetical protein